MNEKFEIELLELLSCNDAFICMCGDFNARTCDFVEDDICNEFGGDSTAGLSPGTAAHYERCNNDTQCNQYGPLFID